MQSVPQQVAWHQLSAPTLPDSMFSSFVQLVGYQNPAAQIPGILDVADVEHLVRAAGKNRVQFNNIERSEWAGDLQSTRMPAAEFFAERIKAEFSRPN